MPFITCTPPINREIPKGAPGNPNGPSLRRSQNLHHMHGAVYHRGTRRKAYFPPVRTCIRSSLPPNLGPILQGRPANMSPLQGGPHLPLRHRALGILRHPDAAAALHFPDPLPAPHGHVRAGRVRFRSAARAALLPGRDADACAPSPPPYPRVGFSAQVRAGAGVSYGSFVCFAQRYDAGCWRDGAMGWARAAGRFDIEAGLWAGVWEGVWEDGRDGAEGYFELGDWCLRRWFGRNWIAAVSGFAFVQAGVAFDDWFSIRNPWMFWDIPEENQNQRYTFWEVNMVMKNACCTSKCGSRLSRRGRVRNTIRSVSTNMSERLSI